MASRLKRDGGLRLVGRLLQERVLKPVVVALNVLKRAVMLCFGRGLRPRPRIGLRPYGKSPEVK